MDLTNKFRAQVEDELGVSFIEFSKFIEADERTVRRWATGNPPVPLAVVMLLAVMHEFDLSPADVRALI